MGVQVSPGPVGKAVVLIVAAVEANEVGRQFPADDQLFEKCRRSGAVGFLDPQCDLQRADLAEVEIGAQIGLKVQRRVIVAVLVSVQFLGDEVIEAKLRFILSPGIKGGRPDGAVDVDLTEDRIDIIQRFARYFQIHRTQMRFAGFERNQKLRKMPMNPRTKYPGRIHLFFGGGQNRDDQVGLDLDQRAINRCGDGVSPLSLDPQVAGVGDHRIGLAGQLDRDGIGRSDPQNKTNPQPGEIHLDLAESFQHETIMPKIGLREGVGQSESDDDGFLAFVGRTDCQFQGVIPSDSLGGLHPIEDKPAISRRGWIQIFDSFRLDHERYRMGIRGLGQPLSRSLSQPPEAVGCQAEDPLEGSRKGEGVGKSQFAGDLLDQGVGVAEPLGRVVHLPPEQDLVRRLLVEAAKEAAQVGRIDVALLGDLGQIVEAREVLLDVAAALLVGGIGPRLVLLFRNPSFGDFERQVFENRRADLRAVSSAGFAVGDQVLEEPLDLVDGGDLKEGSRSQPNLRHSFLGPRPGKIDEVFDHRLLLIGGDPVRHSRPVGEDRSGRQGMAGPGQG